ncbi:hypothetical protein GUJ93_ZPchr0009g1569 [Zizania palustris]|uniref:C2H2-type domain-containing protein n=1 Tax=Zizania palustris TaxID=103762 RepID=A0A8J5RAS2_ZIZPA|nr:hypothetical protein GUJ93_ZPchr0009g1569 [Zizania palustris]
MISCLRQQEGKKETTAAPAPAPAIGSPKRKNPTRSIPRCKVIDSMNNKESAVDSMASSDHQSPKIPDAVVALAQAAAKANGEAEKYLPGWPLFSPPKLELQKCTKCSRQFCSSINYRRHIRVHRPTFKLEKDFLKNRGCVAAFWDKLTMDQAKTILSLADVVLKGVSGPSILTALSAWMCKPGCASLPVAYATAGNKLVELIQTTASGLPVSSNDLFIMLDEASEHTFLCTNPAACIQKFMFGGDADRIATELKNVVACTSYMLEQKLVEAWCADKAAEALRCQKLLVEEEEAAQKRQAELIERKRMKKLRQKEQRLKDFKDEDTMDRLPGIVDGATDLSGIQSLKATSGPDLYEQEYDNSLVVLSIEHDIHDPCPKVNSGAILRQQVLSRDRLDRTENLAQNSSASGSAVGSNYPGLPRYSHYRGTNVSAVSNRNKTWAKKVRTEIEQHRPKDELSIDDGQDIVLNKKSRVLIGSISVAVEDVSECFQDIQCAKEYPTRASQLSVVNHHEVKLMQPISHEEIGNEYTSCNDVDVSITPTAEAHSSSSVMTDGSSCSSRFLQGTMFSSKEAAAFLSQSNYLTGYYYTIYF